MTKRELQQEIEEQARLLGMGAEREARLMAQLEEANRSIAKLQGWHASAWNRGHQSGLRASEEIVTNALDAVKADAWGNTQLTDALMQAEGERDELRNKLAVSRKLLEDAVYIIGAFERGADSQEYWREISDFRDDALEIIGSGMPSKE